jgi:hypothetical protein
VKSVSILRGRDRMCSVLEPLLGYEMARERANNIAQVLAILPDDPVEVARAMLLRSVQGDDLARVAEQVGDAWELGVSEMERVA